MITIRRLLSVSLAVGSLVVCVAAAPSASAQEAAAPPAAAPPPAGAPAPAAPPAAPEPHGARTHDGFYLRLGGGYGYTSTSTDPETKLKGGGGAFGLSIGGSPIPGLAIAGTMFVQLQKTSITVNGNDFPNDTNWFYLGIGPLVDFYPDPKAGLHFGGTVHYATWSRTNLTAGGYGLGLHGGYDFFFSDSWSVGPTLQLLYANTDKDSVKFSTTSVSLMITLVDH
jgi:hypothetical protein